PESMVALFLHNSIEALVGLFGILKAGGAYVPLDPATPPERLTFMLQDAQVSIVLTKTSLLKQLPDGTATILCLDDLEAVFAEMSVENPISQVQEHNLAYLIYTSGSTGRPKGVAITHHNLWHSTQARPAYYSEPVSSYLLLSSI